MVRTILFLALACLVTSDGEELIGTKAPEWPGTDWVSSAPIALGDLEGKVVLVRWFMDPRCPHCSASSSALEDWHQRFESRGLQVIGMYHHKSSSPVTKELVAGYAEHYGFTFPIGIDRKWKALRAWWLDPVPEARFTSVSFLLDKTGTIRAIHDGGTYRQGDADHQRLEAAIETLLSE